MPTLRRKLNSRTFDVTLINRRNIGKTAEELVALWNAEHPEDHVAD